MKPNFLESVDRSGGPKKSKKSDKNLSLLYVHFLLEYESINGLLTFRKNHLSGKNLVVEL